MVVLNIVNLILSLVILFFLIKSNIKKITKEEKNFIEEIDFVEDILSYCMSKELSVTIMQNTQGKMALYEMLEDGSTLSIMELFVSANKKGSSGYNESLKEAQQQIDAYIENKQTTIDMSTQKTNPYENFMS